MQITGDHVKWSNIFGSNLHYIKLQNKCSKSTANVFLTSWEDSKKRWKAIWEKDGQQKGEGNSKLGERQGIAGGRGLCAGETQIRERSVITYVVFKQLTCLNMPGNNHKLIASHFPPSKVVLQLS